MEKESEMDRMLVHNPIMLRDPEITKTRIGPANQTVDH